jgi:molecular chaperone DnaJ
MSKRDYYEILGIEKNASEADIKKAYRKMAIKHHPDKNPGDASAEEKFKEAAEAYEVLSNPQKRQQYDQFGHAGMNGGGFGGGGTHMNMDDIFSQFGDIFGDAFGGGFGGFGGRGRTRTVKGSNLRVKLKLTLDEIVNGVEKKIKVNRLENAEGVEFGTCNTCKGNGQVTRITNTFLGAMQTTQTCQTCNGSGKVVTKRPNGVGPDGLERKEVVIPINIPAGVEHGMQLTVRGKGNAAPGGGINGDLLIIIEEVEDQDLKRDGNNLLYDLHISFVDAALGNNFEIPVVNGKAKIKVEPGTQSGKVLRLKGKGIPDVNGYGTGDLLVSINVYTPQKLSSEEKATLEKLRNSANFTPNPEKAGKSFFQRMRDHFKGEE